MFNKIKKNNNLLESKEIKHAFHQVEDQFKVIN